MRKTFDFVYDFVLTVSVLTLVLVSISGIVRAAEPPVDIELSLFCDTENTVASIIEAQDMRMAFVQYAMSGNCVALSSPIPTKLGKALRVYILKTPEGKTMRMAVYEVIVDGKTFYSFGPAQ